MMLDNGSSANTFANIADVYNTQLKFLRNVNEIKLNINDSLLLLGKSKDLKKLRVEHLSNSLSQLNVNQQFFHDSLPYLTSKSIIDESKANNANGSYVSWFNKFIINKITDTYSRHNTPSRAHVISKIVKDNSYGENQLIVIACERANSIANICAVARTYPLYNGKSELSKKRNVYVSLIYTDTDEVKNELNDDELKCFSALAESVRLTAKIVDAPCADMNTDDFLNEVKKVGKELNIEPLVIEGEELKRRGFGGIYHVGKTALNSPKLVVLSNIKPEASRTVAWVGKGIVYDTGGLCLKSRPGMCTMKVDCGGAAGMLGAFYASVKLGFKDNLHAVFCLAENAIGPAALRPDDIIKLYSGKTVEITNTDAEGRLVLGDGVAYAKKDLKADVIVDMATLTGAQGPATGKYHAALLTNNEKWEEAFVKVGRQSGDLCFPLVFAPELQFSEFKSEIADMTNSVKNASNASCACAGLFIHSHLGSNFDGVWVHLDIASPVTENERGTGYGVSLLASMFGDSSENYVLNEIGIKTYPLPLKISTQTSDE